MTPEQVEAKNKLEAARIAYRDAPIAPNGTGGIKECLALLDAEDEARDLGLSLED